MSARRKSRPARAEVASEHGEVGDVAKVLRLLGLGVRGGLAVVGVEQTRGAAMTGKLRLAVVAADASHNSRDKIVPLLEARDVKMIVTESAAALGGAVGRETTAVVGVIDSELARGIRAAYGAIRRTG